MKNFKKILREFQQRLESFWSQRSRIGNFRNFLKLDSISRLLKKISFSRPRSKPKNHDATLVIKKPVLQDWSQWLKAIQSKIKAPKKNDLENFRIYGTWALVIFFASEIVTGVFGIFFPPEVQKALRTPIRNTRTPYKPSIDLQIVLDRNLFNRYGLIPGDIDADSIRARLAANAPAVPTSMSMQLIGTVILKNEELSLATVDIRETGRIYPLRKGDEIPGVLQVFKVESKKLIFINFKSGRKEFISMPEDRNSRAPIYANQFQNSQSLQKTQVLQVGGVTKKQLQRAEVSKQLQNLNQILTQARAVQHFKNGSPAGYKLTQIVKGSIYEQLGLKNEDIIASVNGDPISDPSKAMDLLKTLNETSHVELKIERDGKMEQFIYEIQ